MGKHYIPQQYLRAFRTSARQPCVWMLSRTSGTWSHAAISKVAQTPDYFPRDVEERLAREVEKPGHRVLGLLRANLVITPQQREDLAVYIAVLIMRVPRKRRRGHELVPKVLDDVMAEVRSELASLRNEANAQRIEDLLRQLARIEARYREDPPEAVKAQIRSPWPSDDVLNAVRSMTWRFVTARAPHFFVTTDNPAYFFESLGVGNVASELTFPISPHLALIGSYQHASLRTLQVAVGTSVVEEVNRRLINGAERFIFSDRQENWIASLANEPELPINRIQW